jgi:hypothetical protein
VLGAGPDQVCALCALYSIGRRARVGVLEFPFRPGVRAMTDDEPANAKGEPVELRRYLWRAAGICRRNGLDRSAVVIADNIDALTSALARRRAEPTGSE